MRQSCLCSERHPTVKPCKLLYYWCARQALDVEGLHRGREACSRRGLASSHGTESQRTRAPTGSWGRRLSSFHNVASYQLLHRLSQHLYGSLCGVCCMLNQRPRCAKSTSELTGFKDIICASWGLHVEKSVSAPLAVSALQCPLLAAKHGVVLTCRSLGTRCSTWILLREGHHDGSELYI